MSSSDLIRWGGLAAMLGGLASLLNVLLGLLVSETSTSVVHLLADSFAVVPLLLILVGMVGFHTLQKANYGGIGRGGFYTVVLGLLAQVLGTITHLSGSEALWCGHLAGEGVASLVWVGFPRRPATGISVGGVIGRIRRSTVRSSVVGGGVRALVPKGYGRRAAFACEVNFGE